MLRNAVPAVGIGLLVERIDAVAHAMRQQCYAAGLVEAGDPIPQGLVISRDIAGPAVMPLANGARRRAVFQRLVLNGKEDMPNRRLQRAGGAAVLEGVGDQLVQQRRHRDVRIVGQSVAKGQRAVRGQLGGESIRQWLDRVVLVLLGLGRLATDGDDGALDDRLGRITSPGLRPRGGHSRDRCRGCRQGRC